MFLNLVMFHSRTHGSGRKRCVTIFTSHMTFYLCMKETKMHIIAMNIKQIVMFQYIF